MFCKRPQPWLGNKFHQDIIGSADRKIVQEHDGQTSGITLKALPVGIRSGIWHATPTFMTPEPQSWQFIVRLLFLIQPRTAAVMFTSAWYSMIVPQFEASLVAQSFYWIWLEKGKKCQKQAGATQLGRAQRICGDFRSCVAKPVLHTRAPFTCLSTLSTQGD